jgi:iron complex transport system substrate-binding protein
VARPCRHLTGFPRATWTGEISKGGESHLPMLARSVLLAVCVLFASCSAAPPNAANAPAKRTFVALVPSLAEDLFAIGAGGRVIGVSQFTDGGPKSIARVADFQSVDTERIVALHPDVVVGIPSQDRLLGPLRTAGVHVVLLRDDTYDDIFADMRTLGDLAGLHVQAVQEIARLRAQTARLQRTTHAFRRRPSVFFVLGTSPLWTVGPTSYIGHLIFLAGGTDAASIAQPWGEYSEEALVRAQPDAIVSGSEAHVRDVEAREPWRSLRALREGHVFTITDPRIVDALFRPGPHYNEGLHWLIQRLTPLAV